MITVMPLCPSNRPRAFLKQLGNKVGPKSYKTLGKAWGRNSEE
jgi:hypothetical protein